MWLRDIVHGMVCLYGDAGAKVAADSIPRHTVVRKLVVDGRILTHVVRKMVVGVILTYF